MESEMHYDWIDLLSKVAGLILVAYGMDRIIRAEISGIFLILIGGALSLMPFLKHRFS